MTSKSKNALYINKRLTKIEDFLFAMYINRQQKSKNGVNIIEVGPLKGNEKTLYWKLGIALSSNRIKTSF